MRRGSIAFLPLVALALAPACGDSTVGTARSDPSCESALQRLDACIAEQCTDGADSICEVLAGKRGNSLFAAEADRCAAMSASDVDRLSAASCEQIIMDARLLAAGKADFPCPTYFPWCNELAPSNTFYHVNVLSSDTSAASLEVLVGEVGTRTILHDGVAYQSLRLDGTGSVGEAGRPDVPTIAFYVGVPSAVDTVVVDSVSRQDVRDVTGLVLAPHADATVEDVPAPPMTVDEDFYELDIEYPGNDYEVDPVSTWRNYRVVRITLHPFQYNPAAKRLSAARRMTVQLSFLDNVAESDDTVDTGEAANASAYGSSIVNYPETAAASGGDTEATDEPLRIRYLVIAHDPLVEVIQPLVELKADQGIATQVVKLSDVGADPEAIKERIAQAYRDSSIEYVLLVGDVEDLPMHVYELPWTSFYPDGDIPGDYWYGLLAGDDMLPEVAVGRMTGSAEELAIQIAKTIAYEKSDPLEGWRSRILLVADDDQYPSKYTACAEQVRTRQYRTGPVDFLTLYGGEHAKAEQVVAQVNDGVGIVAYRGHGSATAWLEWNGADFSIGEHELGNAQKTPVVFSVACLNAAAQEQPASHGEQWVRHPGGGAVGFLGATKRSWTPPNDLFMKQLFIGMLDDGVTEAMSLVNRARAEMIRQYAHDDSGADNAMMYIWLGDPSLQVGQAFQSRGHGRVAWCATQSPDQPEIAAGAPVTVSGQVWARGVTEAIGQGMDIRAELGVGPERSAPGEAAWSWVAAEYQSDRGNNDEYSARIAVPAPGSYSIVMRFKGAEDPDWTYCDVDGSQNGLDPNELGLLTVR